MDIQTLINENNGYLKIADAVAFGISKASAISYAREQGLEKVAHGVYITKETWLDPYYLLQTRNKQIIFSHETALFLHGLSDRESQYPVVTVKRGYNASHLKLQNVKIHTVREEWFESGLDDAVTFAGNKIRIYDKERCICDIVRNRMKMDIQVFQASIKSYFTDTDKNLHRLMQYAKMMNIDEKMRQYTEVML